MAKCNLSFHRDEVGTRRIGFCLYLQICDGFILAIKRATRCQIHPRPKNRLNLIPRKACEHYGWSVLPQTINIVQKNIARGNTVRIPIAFQNRNIGAGLI